jgi:hypothetical protein
MGRKRNVRHRPSRLPDRLLTLGGDMRDSHGMERDQNRPAALVVIQRLERRRRGPSMSTSPRVPALPGDTATSVRHLGARCRSRTARPPAAVTALPCLDWRIPGTGDVNRTIGRGSSTNRLVSRMVVPLGKDMTAVTGPTGRLIMYPSRIVCANAGTLMARSSGGIC